MSLARDLRSYLQQAMDLHQAGALDRAMQMYRDVLAQHPGQADALHLLGAGEWQKGNLEEAESLMRRAIAIWGGDPGYFSDLGGVLEGKGTYAEAIREYKHALKLNPAHRLAREGIARAYGKYGFELAATYRWDEAEAAYLKLLEIYPNDPAALNNLAEIYQHAGAREKACAIYDKALEAKPDFPIAHYNRAICELGLERLAEGWADLAAGTRGWLKIIDKREDLPWLRLPLWDGSDLRGRKILVWGDQGIGDEILFASMIPDLIARGARVTVECTDRLVPIFKRSFPDIAVIARATHPLPGNYDWQAPGLWLGRWLRPDFERFPRHAGYLKADARRTATLRARYEAFGKKKIIGISWHSSSGGRAAHRRMSLRELAAALPLEDTVYIDLQYGDRRAEYEDAQRTFPGFVFHHDAEIDPLLDLDGFASQVVACDEVITIGNTTAHMAGALGISGDALLPIAGLTWYWFETRSECPWYPSIKLLRKKREGDWGAALSELSTARRLTHWI